MILGVLLQLAIVARAPIDTAQPVNFHAMAAPDTVFVGQQVTYEVGVFLDDQLRLRLRRNPEFVPPEPRAMLAYDLPSTATTPGARRVGDHEYEVHVFERAFFPLEAGRYEIPAAELSYSLPLSMSFFSREESHTLAAESLTVVVLPPPAAGRPANYGGAVGELHVDERLDAHRVRAGDPVLLTVMVGGRGNVKLLPRPMVAVPWGSAVAAEERVRIDTSTSDVHGTKEFDWVVTPRDTGVLALPPVGYPYFNPYTERYEIALTRADTLRVGAGSLAALDTTRADAGPPLAIRTLYRGNLPSPPYTRPEFLAAAVCAPIPALLLGGARRVRRRRRRKLSAADRLKILSRSRRPVPAPALRRAYVAALAERFALSPATLTERGALSHVLRREGCTGPSGQRAERLLDTLDRTAYGPGPELPKDIARQIYEAFVSVTREARDRIIPVLLLCAVIGVAAKAIDVAGTQAAEQFRQGLTAYTRHQYGPAAIGFAAAGHLAPRAADAWANAGTAAWVAGDTADAVVGWQRAARLESFAPDVHERLNLVRASQEGPIAAPPRVDAGLVASIALGCWVLLCLLTALRPGRLKPLVAVLAGLAIVGAASAAWLAEMTAGDHLVVIGPGAGLSSSPALGAERVAALDAGDVGHVEERSGAWVRVRLDGDREGWVEMGRTIPIGEGN
ncbi:MAG TPA: SH3 domain-containing protein [Gemmatimonadaceae bacterium]|nr:SH3 domain-containing protein [Gemmatimonadaceae bacterium]